MLRPETVERMTKNQIGNLRVWGADEMGYGVSVVGENRGKDFPSVGSYSWSGAFNTAFWIDPRADLIGIFMAQRFPPEGAPPDGGLGQDFKRLTYEAMTETGR